MDAPARQIRDSIVDLVERISLSDQRVQVELAAFIPADEDGEITVWTTQTATSPGVGALGNTEFLHINAPQFLDRPHQTRGAAFLEADRAWPRGVQDLLLCPCCPNSVNGV